MAPLTVGGQCEGYAGIFLALQSLLNVEHAWYAEIDPNASKVLAHHYPGVTNHGDITRPNGTGPYGLPRRQVSAPRRARQAAKRHARRVQGWRDMAKPVDIFTSGFPCTDYSLAGKREGSKGKHALWTPGVIPAVEALRPPLAIFENVQNLLRIEQGQVFAKVLADLDALGYAVSWTTVGACKVGACHHRHRVFIAATLVDTDVPLSDPIAHRTGAGWAPAQMLLFGDPGPVRWPAAGHMSAGTVWEMPSDVCGGGDEVFPTPRVSDTNGAGKHGDGGSEIQTAVAMLPTPLAHDATRNRTSPGDLARKSPVLEAVRALPQTPVVADARGTRNATAGRSAGASENWSAGWTLSDVVHAGHVQSLLPTPRASDGTKGGPNQRGSSGDVMLPAAVQPERFGKYASAVARHEAAYGLPAPDPTELGRNGKPRLAPGFPEWMQGLPRGHLTDVVERSAALKLAGNGVNWRQCAYALPLLPTFRAAVRELTAARLELAA